MEIQVNEVQRMNDTGVKMYNGCVNKQRIAKEGDFDETSTQSLEPDAVVIFDG